MGRSRAKRRVDRIVGLVHKWAGLILFLQLLVWTIGGLVFALSPLEEVRSEHITVTYPDPRMATRQLMDVVDAVAAGQRVHRVEALVLGGLPAVLVDHDGSDHKLYSAKTGKPLVLNEARVKRIAETALVGSPAAETVAFLEGEAPIDYRRAMPVWRVSFADGLRIYISPQTGKILAKRSTLWRVFDFFWMLHIMDYEGRDNINSPLLVLFAASAMLFVLTGVVLLFTRPLRRISWGRKQLP